MYKHFIFGGGFGFTCVYVCMLLSIYKHLIFGVFLGLQICMYVCFFLYISIWFLEVGDWGYRAWGAAHEEEGAEAITVSEHNQGCECADGDDNVEGAGGGSIENGRAFEAAVEDQELLWWHWLQVYGGWDCRLCCISDACCVLRMLPSSQGGSIEIEVKGQQLNGVSCVWNCWYFLFFCLVAKIWDLDEVLSLTESESWIRLNWVKGFSSLELNFFPCMCS